MQWAHFDYFFVQYGLSLLSLDFAISVLWLHVIFVFFTHISCLYSAVGANIVLNILFAVYTC